VLDRLFDEGKEDTTQYFDLSKARRPNQEPKRMNVDFPLWMVNSLDHEAKRVGVTRPSLIKLWPAERLEHAASHPCAQTAQEWATRGSLVAEKTLVAFAVEANFSAEHAEEDGEVG
jgi:hypothetical protein